MRQLTIAAFLGLLTVGCPNATRSTDNTGGAGATDGVEGQTAGDDTAGATAATDGDPGTGDTGETAAGTSGDTAGGDTAGGDTAGGDTAGGDTAGGDTAGGTTGPDCDPACVDPEVCINGACGVPMLCQPDSWVCQGLVAKKQCKADGSGFLEPSNCPGDQYCTAGQCGLKCSLDPKWGAYVGCVFWTVDLPVWDDPTLPNADTLPHAVVVSNPNELDATVSFTPPPGVNFNFNELTVPGSSSKVFEFPSLDTSGSNITDLGIRLESDRPVLVHQFNPWDNTFSNDASLLLPEPLLGQEHLILSWPTDARCLLELPIPGLEGFGGPCAHSFLTVVAPFDGTSVTIRASARVMPTDDSADPTVTMIPKGGIATFTLNAGQVLNLDALPEDIFGTADLTGTLVLSDKPVAVFSGHDSAAIDLTEDTNNPFPGPEDNNDDGCCLDHLEEQMIPVSLLANSYVCAKSKPRGGENDLWRIIAADDNVTLTTSPPIDGLNGVTLKKKGDWVEAATEESFEVTGTGRIQIGQYLAAQGNTSSFNGDPSMILAIPTERWRATYPIMAPSTYKNDFVSIIRKHGQEVSLDGTPVGGGEFNAIAGGKYELGWVEISDGVHTITSQEPFGLSAYGYDSAASYGYPGGMTIPGESNP